MIVTFKPRDSRIDARDAAAIPLPKEETTPPVTKIYFVAILFALEIIKEMDKMNGNNHQDGNTVYSKTLHFANKN